MSTTRIGAVRGRRERALCHGNSDWESLPVGFNQHLSESGNECIKIQRDGWMDGCMEKCINGWMDGWMGGWMDGLWGLQCTQDIRN